MFFDKIKNIPKIAAFSGCAVFVIPKDTKVEIKNAIVLKPEEKTVITVDQVRELLNLVNTKQTEDRFIIIRPADALSEVAENAFLKALEEPKEKIHYLLITDSPSKLLPTILSRSAIYFLKTTFDFNSDIDVSEDVKKTAKQIITAKPADLLMLAEQITKKKNNVREYTLEVIGSAIEILYKSYFITEKEVFLKKLPKFLKLYENIEKNGHIKLHLVADLI